MTTLFAPVSVKPRAIVCDVLLTLTSAASHHDPAIQDDSNVLHFNRQKQLLPTGALGQQANAEEVRTFAAAHPCPADVAELAADLPFPTFVAVALARLFLDLYNASEGTGVFSGMERYERLEARLRSAAIRAVTLRGLWDRLCDSLRVPIHPSDADRALARFWALPRGTQESALAAVTREYRTVVAIARLWHSQAKLQVAEYAEKAGQEQAAPSIVVERADVHEEDTRDFLPGLAVVEVPAISANTVRHELVRAPGWTHFAGALGFVEAEPGFGIIPAGAEAIFVNGGNIRSGSKQPSNPFVLANEARRRYPLLDLLGGVTDSFDLGESRLQVGSWLVCRENRVALAGTTAEFEPAADVSAFDLLDEVTHTRQATDKGVGQMIYTFETLCAGAVVLARLSLSPYTPELARGALAAALQTFADGVPTIGGQAARGFGWCDVCRGRLEEIDDCLPVYEAYLEAHAEELRRGLVDGTLGTGTRVLS